MIAKISAQNSNNFKGAVKIPTSHQKTKKFDQAIRTFSREKSAGGITSISDRNFSTYFFRGIKSDPVEPKALRLLKKMEIPFIHNKKSDLSPKEGHDFHEYVEFGK